MNGNNDDNDDDYDNNDMSMMMTIIIINIFWDLANYLYRGYRGQYRYHHHDWLINWFPNPYVIIIIICWVMASFTTATTMTDSHHYDWLADQLVDHKINI